MFLIKNISLGIFIYYIFIPIKKRQLKTDRYCVQYPSTYQLIRRRVETKNGKSVLDFSLFFPSYRLLHFGLALPACKSSRLPSKCEIERRTSLNTAFIPFKLANLSIIPRKLPPSIFNCNQTKLLCFFSDKPIIP